VNKSPAFQFYPAQFLAGTASMTQAEVGAYIRLMCYQWLDEGIDRSTTVQQRLAGGPVTPSVRRKFSLAKREGKPVLLNARLEAERGKQNAFREKQAEKGRKSAQSRATAVQPLFNHGSTAGVTETQPMAVDFRLQPEGNSLSLSSSLSSKLIRGKTPLELVNTVNNSVKKTDKGDKASKKLGPTKSQLAQAFEETLTDQWINDAGKWVNRIKAETAKCERVLAEVQSAVKEQRIKTTPAQYAEQIWKEFV